MPRLILDLAIARRSFREVRRHFLTGSAAVAGRYEWELLKSVVLQQRELHGVNFID